MSTCGDFKCFKRPTVCVFSQIIFRLKAPELTSSWPKKRVRVSFFFVVLILLMNMSVHSGLSPVRRMAITGRD